MNYCENIICWQYCETKDMQCAKCHEDFVILEITPGGNMKKRHVKASYTNQSLSEVDDEIDLINIKCNFQNMLDIRKTWEQIYNFVWKIVPTISAMNLTFTIIRFFSNDEKIVFRVQRFQEKKLRVRKTD